MKTGISPMWSKVAKGWLGNKSGRHCHWCIHAVFEDGTVTCGNPKSKFHDGDRIRTWDGIYCAKQCGLFELDDWYKDDENYWKPFEEAK